MSAKLQKTIARQQQKVEEGQFYEAHQQLRVIAARYTKANDWESAADILSAGATMLLKADQGGSGGDLCLLLVDVYVKAPMPCDLRNRARLLYLLRAFPAKEPTRKRFIAEMLAWSAKAGEFPAGDPELHHVSGCLLADNGDVIEAERHLVLGTNDSPAVLAGLEFTWYKSDETSTAPQYAARAVLPYLLVGNLRAANKAWLLFTTKLAATPGLSVAQVESNTSDVRVYPGLPLLNFLGLLLLAVERGAADLFRQLKSQYAVPLKQLDGAWDDALAQIGEMYFGIKIPSQSNPLLDMMGSFLMGGGGGASKQAASKTVQPAPAPALD